MKTKYYLGISVLMLFIATSMKVEQEQPQLLIEKVAWFEIDLKEDAVLAQPYSKAWREMWHILDPDINFSGSPAMNLEKYRYSFEGRTDNLYTVIHPMIIEGLVKLYSPYNPESFGLGTGDDGELRFPVIGESGDETFLTSQALRDQYCYYLGMFGPQSDLPMVTMYGEDSTVVDADGTISYAYPPRDYLWYSDKDIIKYKVRVSVMVDKNGKEKKRIIRSIAPVVYQFRDGQISGEKELFWLDFNELKSTFKKTYFFNGDGKPVSYLKYFEGKIEAAKL